MAMGAAFIYSATMNKLQQKNHYTINRITATNGNTNEK